MNTQQSSRIGRWLVLIAVIGNVAFNYLYQTIFPSLPSINEVTDRYKSLFTPAGYAFAIWGLIFLAFIIYAIVQLLPAQRDDRIYDRLAAPTIIANLLSGIWTAVFTAGYIGWSVLIIAGALIAITVGYVHVRNAIATTAVNSWLTVPFSLLTSWLSVATIAAISVGLSALRWEGQPLTPAAWTIIMVIIAGLLGIIIAFNKRDFIYPLVIAWATLAIWVARRADYQGIATVAMIVAIITALVAGFILIQTIREKGYIRSRERQFS